MTHSDFSDRFHTARQALYDTLDTYLQGQMFESAMADAIRAGVGEKHVLQLQELINGNDHGMYFGPGLGKEIRAAVIAYKPVQKTA